MMLFSVGEYSCRFMTATEMCDLVFLTLLAVGFFTIKVYHADSNTRPKVIKMHQDTFSNITYQALVVSKLLLV